MNNESVSTYLLVEIASKYVKTGIPILPHKLYEIQIVPHTFIQNLHLTIFPLSIYSLEISFLYSPQCFFAAQKDNSRICLIKREKK